MYCLHIISNIKHKVSTMTKEHTFASEIKSNI